MEGNENKTAEPWYADLQCLRIEGSAASLRDRLVLLGCLGLSREDALRAVDFDEKIKSGLIWRA